MNADNVVAQLLSVLPGWVTSPVFLIVGGLISGSLLLLIFLLSDKSGGRARWERTA